MREVLAEPGDDGTPLPRAPRALASGDDERAATDARHHDLEQVQRVGDHPAVEDVVDGDGLVVEDRIRVGERVGPLVDGDLRDRALVVAELRAVPLGDHRVPGVLRDVPVRDLELGLGRAVEVRRRAVHPARIGRFGRRRSGDRSRGQRADHDVADAELDGGGRAPHHPHRRRAAEVDVLGVVHLEPAVLGDGRGHEHLRLADVIGADDPVDLGRRDAGVVERERGQVGPLLERELGFAREAPLGRVLGDAHHRRVTPESHSTPHLLVASRVRPAAARRRPVTLPCSAPCQPRRAWSPCGSSTSASASRGRTARSCCPTRVPTSSRSSLPRATPGARGRPATRPRRPSTR